MSFNRFRFISNVSFIYEPKTILYFQNNNNENGVKYSNFVCHLQA
jgi:hypothetical protein